MNMDEQEEVQVRLLIADRHYPLKVRKSEVEFLHEAEKLVNEKVKTFQHIYAGKDKQDFLAMCALTLATENKSLKDQLQYLQSDFKQDFDELDRLLSSVTV